MRKTYSDELKFKVALEACSNQYTTHELSQKHDGIAHSLIQKWKAHLKTHGAQVFAKAPFKSVDKQLEEKHTKLYEQIGRLSVEIAFLKKNLGE